MTIETNTQEGGDVVEAQPSTPEGDIASADVIKVDATKKGKRSKPIAPKVEESAGSEDGDGFFEDLAANAVDAELAEDPPVNDATPETPVDSTVDTVTPDTTSPDATTNPDTTTNTVNPDTSSPDTTTPDATTPDATNPDTTVVRATPETTSGGTSEKTEEEKLAEIDAALSSARSTYAEKLVAWKNTQRSEKGKFHKLLSDLGFEKQKPEAERPAELIEAENAYLAAKKKKSATIPEKEIQVAVEGATAGAPMEVDKKMVLDAEALLKMSEAEYKALQVRIAESLPPLEKGIILKGFEAWSKMPPNARRAASIGIMSTITLATGGVGAAAFYTGKRIVKTVVGTGASQLAGKLVQMDIDRRNKINDESIKESYTREISMDAFEEVERQMMRLREKTENLKKKQRVYKAGAMVLSGAGATMALNHMMDSASEAVLHASGYDSNADNTVSVDPAEHPSFEPGGDYGHDVPPIHDHVPSAEGANDMEIYNNGGNGIGGGVENAGGVIDKPYDVANVELSSKGFIQSISDLKAKVIDQYGGEDHVPADVKANFLDKSSVDLAKEYGFYDPEHGLSGMGLKSETLSLDSHGNILYHDIHGADHVMYDAEHHTTGHFGGKMFNPEDSKPGHAYNAAAERGPEDASVDDPDLTRHIEPGTDTDSVNTGSEGMVDGQNNLSPDVESGPESVPAGVYQATEVINGQNYDVVHIPTGNTYVNVAENALDHSKVVQYDGYQIGHENMVGDFGKTLVLDDKFQNGAQYTEVRQAFTEALKETDGPLQTFGKGIFNIRPTAAVDSMEFEGGRIHVMQGLVEKEPNSMAVFLNGKEIAKGVMTNNGPKLKLLDEPGIKGGWFRGDTVYERAFKQSKSLVEGMKDIRD